MTILCRCHSANSQNRMCLYKQNNVNGLSLYTVCYAIEQCSTINLIMLIILQIMLTGNVTVGLCYMKVMLVISNHINIAHCERLPKKNKVTRY